MSPWRPARSTFTPSVFHHFDAAADFGEVSAQLFCSLPDPGCCTWGVARSAFVVPTTSRTSSTRTFSN